MDIPDTSRVRSGPIDARHQCEDPFWRVLRTTLAVQAGYYVVTGIWPLIGYRSFEMVLGPKTDDWLVRLVGLLVVAAGITILVGLRYERPQAETITLAWLFAASLAAIDVAYSAAGRISSIYLGDALLELFFTVVLSAAALRRLRCRPRRVAGGVGPRRLFDAPHPSGR